MTKRFPVLVGWLAVAVAPIAATSVVGGGADPHGKQIYTERCADCHGEDGDGVDGEYDEALHGDWSLAKLTRVITRTMPDDDPDLCVGEEADAVARYIYDAFYSPEAWARLNPARVELVHLTNRQYANAVADLIAEFTGGNGDPGEERGLDATYYSTRNSKRDSKVAGRIDPYVDFFYGNKAPVEPVGKPDSDDGGKKDKDEEIDPDEQFSIQWRGSILAPETGVYEFIVETPNGVRLWVNDNDEALIDGWVSTGRFEVRRASVRLLGGRAYPIRLNFFKFKDKTAGVTLKWKPPHGIEEPIPTRNLAPRGVASTFVVGTPFPADDSSMGYERGIAVSKAWDEATTYAAIEAANHVTGNLDRFSRSRPEDDDRMEKVAEFCRRFVESAFRHRLSEEETEFFVTSRLEGADVLETAVKRVVILALKSPRFLYIGTGCREPNGFAAAERLAMGLWDSLPDERLLSAAKDGRLETREQIETEARRMVREPETRSKIRTFLHHWLHIDHVEDLSKDISLFPDFKPGIIADLRTSLNLFLDEVVWSDASDYRDLLQADYLYVNDRLAGFYGSVDGAGGGFYKTRIDPADRSGVITHPYLLAAFSYPKSTSPIHRGVFLTRNVIGRALKPPPKAVAFKDADFSPDMTMREKVAELTKPGDCQVCHSVINPLGFSLEQFDAVGRYRTHEKDRPVDTISDFLTDEGEVIKLTGARDVAKYALSSEEAVNGFIEQLFHAIVKQPMLAYGPKTLEHLRDFFIGHDYSIRELIVEIATLSALHDVGVSAPESEES